MKEIALAGGCFWGVDEYFSRKKGVKSTKAGYANGIKENPTYNEVCTGRTGHAETVLVQYDESLISLTEILEKFFKVIDPTILNRQGNDIGTQYRTGIYYLDEADIPVITAFIDLKRTNYKKSIVTEVLPLKNFYDAEEYHQDYLKKNPRGYCHIDLNTD
ncbi:peptide-methionine (S)-S-oxide reductase MsrA [Youngiibacter multivorans]|uniref:Peptide methionine sulfoxide reductase MsrA n=1 Tax=Youngiibacter multivorans TaxID=937251 RepID=A0ABS4G0Q7_9CLOT|nr:peptide-methionine (S)-S-oxide reductase MsrA [Youngiibacter multivorans]MBP1918116.1 peptide-methionine (S)-S-oxide reductase [Youngiibacter multivorans]